MKDVQWPDQTTSATYLNIDLSDDFAMEYTLFYYKGAFYLCFDVTYMINHLKKNNNNNLISTWSNILHYRHPGQFISGLTFFVCIFVDAQNGLREIAWHLAEPDDNLNNRIRRI